MRRIWITKAGPPEVLMMKEEADPVPGDEQVLVDVRAAGINFADIMARMGMYQDAPDIPCVVGYEVAGIVEQVGAKVTEFEPGDQVISMTRFGGYASKVAVDVQQVFPKPEEWSFEEGAGMPVNYLTAYQLLVVMGSLREGNTVLIHSAGGGVGTAATQIARIFDATILGTASALKHDYIKENGVDYPIDYRTKDYVKEVMAITGGRGVDIVIDPLGGKFWKKSYTVLRSTGRLLMFGASSMTRGKSRSLLSMVKTFFQIPVVQFHPLHLINQNRGVLGVNLGHLWHERDMVQEWVTQLEEWADEGSIRPHIDAVFSFEEAPAAHHYIQDRKNCGKVCLKP